MFHRPQKELELEVKKQTLELLSPSGLHLVLEESTYTIAWGHERTQLQN